MSERVGRDEEIATARNSHWLSSTHADGAREGADRTKLRTILCEELRGEVSRREKRRTPKCLLTIQNAGDRCKDYNFPRHALCLRQSSLLPET